MLDICQYIRFSRIIGCLFVNKEKKISSSEFKSETGLKLSNSLEFCSFNIYTPLIVLLPLPMNMTHAALEGLCEASLAFYEFLIGKWMGLSECHLSLTFFTTLSAACKVGGLYINYCPLSWPVYTGEAYGETYQVCILFRCSESTSWLAFSFHMALAELFSCISGLHPPLICKGMGWDFYVIRPILVRPFLPNLPPWIFPNKIFLFSNRFLFPYLLWRYYFAFRLCGSKRIVEAKILPNVPVNSWHLGWEVDFIFWHSFHLVN